MIALLAAGPQSFAFDVGGADILGLRLGQSEAEILSRLARQGADIEPSEAGIAAKTKDGLIVILLDGANGAYQIRYTFRGHGLNEAAVIQDSMVNRFGPPDEPRPMRWCQEVGADEKCLREKPFMTFVQDALVLILQNGE